MPEPAASPPEASATVDLDQIEGELTTILNPSRRTCFGQRHRARADTRAGAISPAGIVYGEISAARLFRRYTKRRDLAKTAAGERVGDA